MKLATFLILNLWSLSSFAFYAHLCELGPDRWLGGREQKCETVKINDSFDKECRSPNELTFRTQGEYLDRSRDWRDNQTFDFEYYTAEVGIHGAKTSLTEASFLVFRRTDCNLKTKLYGCMVFTHQGKNYIDRLRLKFKKKIGHSYYFEAFQNVELRAQLVIEDRGQQKFLRFVDERGNVTGAPALGLMAPVQFIF